MSRKSATDFGVVFKNPKPAFPRGTGPRLCLDAAHHNFQTDNRTADYYDAFLDLLMSDGYRLSEISQTFSAERLANCDVLVSIVPRASFTPEFPHPSVLTRDELEAVYRWLEGGGGLLLITDHTPAMTAFSDLAAMLGVAMLDGDALLRFPFHFPEMFTREAGLLRDHPILRGRDDTERVDRVGTYQGSAFQASREWSPLLVFGSESIEFIDLGYNFRDMKLDDWPHFAIAGWLLAGTRHVGKGRVALLGESGMCAAAFTGPKREPDGLNDPQAPANPQFCVNTVRWLSGVLGD